MDKETHILVVDDELAILNLLKDILEDKGYEVSTAQSGKEALEKLKKKIPHLIILDILMPEMDGYEVCRRIRKNAILKHLPIIMLTAKSNIEDEIEGWRVGIDEYIVKPFNPEELLTIIETIIYRTYLGLDANPLTKLPGNNTIREEINKCIGSKKPFAACFLDLDNFKAFNDHYGFDKGDEAIKLTAGVIINAVHKTITTEEDFIGHIGGDDFVVITHPDKVDIICQEIIREFDELIPNLYSEEDRKRGYIIGFNRKGEREEFPIMTISIGVVTNKRRKLKHLAQVSEIGAELKEYAKTFFGSNYIVDKRMGEEKEVYRKERQLLEKQNILLVDDDEDMCTILSMILKNEGYQIIIAHSGADALAQIEKQSFNVVLLDIRLPDMSGLEILKKVKEKDPNVIVIIMTGYSSMEGVIDALRYDAYDYLQKPLDIEKVKVIIKRGIEQQQLEIKNKKLVDTLTKKNIELSKKVEETLMLNKSLQALYLGTMGALVGTIEAKDRYTKGHSDRVTKYAVSIAKELKLSDNDLEFIRYACQLHDIGKIGIRDYILSKSDKLTKEEWEEIKLHPITGANILKPLEFLGNEIPYIKHHHERYDGTGYPQGLKMESIPLGARIIAVADAFDAMTSERPYRRAKSVQEAINELKENAGTQFDPKVVAAFLNLIEKGLIEK
jgi:diguanylate cyclase (GGDEF)-like protein